jgi:hypothetical protein
MCRRVVHHLSRVGADGSKEEGRSEVGALSSGIRHMRRWVVFAMLYLMFALHVPVHCFLVVLIGLCPAAARNNRANRIRIVLTNAFCARASFLRSLSHAACSIPAPLRHAFTLLLAADTVGERFDSSAWAGARVGCMGWRMGGSNGRHGRLGIGMQGWVRIDWATIAHAFGYACHSRVRGQLDEMSESGR